MATVNKSSLRAEFDALKARFESLCAAGKMSAESRALFDALLMLFELLMAVFMEKHTPKSSANSSLPASQSPNDETARTRPGAKGKGPSYNDARCANTRTREYVKVLSVDAGGRCGEDLTDAACTDRERRTLIDIVFEKVVRHADAQIKHCARCHTETRARFPHEMPGPLQYGPGIKAYVVHLLIAQMLSLKRVAQSMHALIGRTLSQATLLGYVAQLHHALAEWEHHAIERLLASPAMHVDETSLRVDRKNHWIHVYSAGTLTVKCLHPKRGCEAIEAIGILPRYAGVAVHDCWASYLSYAHCDHALCGAHRAHLGDASLELLGEQADDEDQDGMDQPHPALDPAYRAREPDRVAAQRIGRRAHTRSPLGMRHHRFERIEFTGQPCSQTVRQQAEGGVALGAVPASDLRPARGLARVGAVACQRTFAVRVIRAALEPCIAPRLGPNPTSPTQRELCRFSLFSTTQVIELLESCTPNSPQYRL